ncbi:MAG: hypothetical protein JWP14_367 [Frankiales bacterium]|nr:hypothetical protein [Frankiales bacterium]
MSQVCSNGHVQAEGSTLLTCEVCWEVQPSQVLLTTTLPSASVSDSVGVTGDEARRARSEQLQQQAYLVTYRLRLLVSLLQPPHAPQHNGDQIRALVTELDSLEAQAGLLMTTYYAEMLAGTCWGEPECEKSIRLASDEVTTARDCLSTFLRQPDVQARLAPTPQAVAAAPGPLALPCASLASASRVTVDLVPAAGRARPQPTPWARLAIYAAIGWAVAVLTGLVSYPVLGWGDEHACDLYNSGDYTGPCVDQGMVHDVHKAKDSITLALLVGPLAWGVTAWVGSGITRRRSWAEQQRVARQRDDAYLASLTSQQRDAEMERRRQAEVQRRAAAEQRRRAVVGQVMSYESGRHFGQGEPVRGFLDLSAAQQMGQGQSDGMGNAAFLGGLASGLAKDAKRHHKEQMSQMKRGQFAAEVAAYDALPPDQQANTRDPRSRLDAWP